LSIDVREKRRITEGEGGKRGGGGRKEKSARRIASFSFACPLCSQDEGGKKKERDLKEKEKGRWGGEGEGVVLLPSYYSARDCLLASAPGSE